jgi:hypothetical protein
LVIKVRMPLAGIQSTAEQRSKTMAGGYGDSGDGAWLNRATGSGSQARILIALITAPGGGGTKRGVECCDGNIARAWRQSSELTACQSRDPVLLAPALSPREMMIPGKRRGSLTGFSGQRKRLRATSELRASGRRQEVEGTALKTAGSRDTPPK